MSEISEPEFKCPQCKEFYEIMTEDNVKMINVRFFLQWLREGLDHFTNDEDHEQKIYLQKRIDQELGES